MMLRKETSLMISGSESGEEIAIANMKNGYHVL